MPEGRFVCETTCVTAMHSPSLVAAHGTGCVGVRRGDPESQGDVVEVGADQATAERSTQKLRQKQGKPLKERRIVDQPSGVTPYRRSWIIRSAGEPLLRAHFQSPWAHCRNPAVVRSDWIMVAMLLLVVI